MLPPTINEEISGIVYYVMERPKIGYMGYLNAF